MSESRIVHYPPAAEAGRDFFRGIADQIWQLRNRGIEPKEIWLSQHVADKMHAMWTFVCRKNGYDNKLPLKISGVKCSTGSTGGQDVVFLYHEKAAANDDRLQRPGSNPLEGNE